MVAYLALSNGGYDIIVRSQVGIAVWWMVLLGALAGILPARVGAAGWVAIGLLGAFAVWTGLASAWSESAERSVIELGRVAAYLGVLVLALALQGRAVARQTIGGLACAIGFVSVLAVLSRLHPQWFPVNQQLEFLGVGSVRKLSYPLNYWNALAGFAAIGVPLLLGVALGARTLAGRALAAAALPISALCIYLTISRGGAVALVVGILVFLMFAPRRLDASATLILAGLGSAILLWAASQRHALRDGVASAVSIHQGTQMIWLALIICAGVALLAMAMGLAARHLERPAVLAPGRRAFVARALAALAVACVVGIAVGAPGWANARWAEFKAPVGTVAVGGEDTVFSRLAGVNGGGRYQYWQSALHAQATDPLKGIGPGTFEFWWARHATAPGFIRNAHTLYFETLAETGVVGLVLLGGLLAFLLAAAVVRSVRAPLGTRIWIAAAVGGLAAFMTSAAFEWVWQMGAIACTAMLLGAVILEGGEPDGVVDHRSQRPRRGPAPRIAFALLAIAGIGAVAVPMAGALETGASRSEAAGGHLVAALSDTRTAERLQPYAATPRMQQALVLEAAGTLSGAAAAARAATAAEPTNWRTWFLLARIEARQGHALAGVAALRTAKRLNPRSPLLGAQ